MPPTREWLTLPQRPLGHQLRHERVRPLQEMHPATALCRGSELDKVVDPERVARAGREHRLGVLTRRHDHSKAHPKGFVALHHGKVARVVAGLRTQRGCKRAGQGTLGGLESKQCPARFGKLPQPGLLHPPSQTLPCRGVGTSSHHLKSSHHEPCEDDGMRTPCTRRVVELPRLSTARLPQRTPCAPIT